MDIDTLPDVGMLAIARVNGVALHAAEERPDNEELRRRACLELLRQAAQREGLLPPGDVPGHDGLISEQAGNAIDRLLERAIAVPEPTEDDCLRHYRAHEADHVIGERVQARHILFAVTPGVDVTALRHRAESVLIDVRSHVEGEDRFADAAGRFSNCPSGRDGGMLGWLDAKDCAPEFARELFGHSEIGVLPRLVHSRFGLHVVEVLAREPGALRSFEAVRGSVASALRQRCHLNAVRQYIALLAGQADLRGVALDAADTPLVQ